MILKSIMPVAVLAALASAPAFAQQVIYSAKGQSAAKQQKDETECNAWAKKQTGYDPAQATPYAVAPPPQHEGERARGAARGAAGGAIIGAIAGGAAGPGAAIGAVAGTMVGGARQRRKQEEYEKGASQHDQAAAQQKQQYQRAYGACFESRGYTVK